MGPPQASGGAGVGAPRQKKMTSRTRLLTILVSAPVIAFTVIGGLLGHAMARTDETFATLRVFHDVVSLIMSNYVEQPNMDSVMRGAMRGLAEGLDSDSAYLTQPQVRQLESADQTGPADVGITLTHQYRPSRRCRARRLPCRQGGNPPGRLRAPGRFAADTRHVGVRGTAVAVRRAWLEGETDGHPWGQHGRAARTRADAGGPPDR